MFKVILIIPELINILIFKATEKFKSIDTYLKYFVRNDDTGSDHSSIFKIFIMMFFKHKSDVPRVLIVTNFVAFQTDLRVGGSRLQPRQQCVFRRRTQ